MELRREIHEGLNVVESWNGANDFILYGRGGEIATNRLEDQEATMLALHLLQNCMVYVNTLMLQRVLGEPIWLERMGTNERRAMTPLFWGHVNPYGTFQLDMSPPAPRCTYAAGPRRPASAARRLTIHGPNATLHLVTRMLVLGHLVGVGDNQIGKLSRNGRQASFNRVQDNPKICALSGLSRYSRTLESWDGYHAWCNRSPRWA